MYHERLLLSYVLLGFNVWLPFLAQMLLACVGLEGGLVDHDDVTFDSGQLDLEKLLCL